MKKPEGQDKDRQEFCSNFGELNPCEIARILPDDVVRDLNMAYSARFAQKFGDPKSTYMGRYMRDHNISRGTFYNAVTKHLPRINQVFLSREQRKKRERKS